MSLTKVKGRDIDESTIYAVSLAPDVESLKKISNNLLEYVNGSLYVSGRVGVNTKTPSKELHVEGDLIIRRNDYVPSGHLVVERYSGSQANELRVVIGSNPGWSSSLLSNGSISLLSRESSDIAFGFVSEETIPLIVKSTGRVGVANLSPSYTFDVGGAGRFSGNLYVSGNLGIGTTSPDQKLDVRGDASITGNVAIGTTTPTTTLDVRGHLFVGSGSFDNPGAWGHTLLLSSTGANARYRLKNSTTQAYMAVNTIGWHGSPANAFVIGTETNHPITFVTNAEARITIANNGNVGIGTTNPSRKLHVNGELEANAIYVGNHEVLHKGNFSNSLKADTLVVNAGQRSVTWTHNIGHTNYAVSVTPATPARHIYYSDKTDNSIVFSIDYPHDENIYFDAILITV